jgi:hypothetical protein
MTDMAPDRCRACDRVGCDRKAASIAYERAGGTKRAPVAAFDRMATTADDCAKHRVDWRGEALASRALLRDVVEHDKFSVRGMSLDLLARIRDHLRGRP